MAAAPRPSTGRRRFQNCYVDQGEWDRKSSMSGRTRKPHDLPYSPSPKSRPSRRAIHRRQRADVIDVTYPYSGEVIATVHEATDAIVGQTMGGFVRKT